MQKAITVSLNGQKEKRPKENKKKNKKKEEEERKKGGKKDCWSGFRFTFERRSLLFPSFWNRSKEKRELARRASITAKLEATFSRIPLNFFPALLQSVSTTERKRAPLLALCFSFHSDTQGFFSTYFPSLFPLFLSCQLLFSSSSFFFFTYRNSSDSPVFDALCRASAPRVSRHRSSLKLSHSSN